VLHSGCNPPPTWRGGASPLWGHSLRLKPPPSLPRLPTLQIKYIVKTTHPDNPACQGSRTAADSGVEKVCSYFEDIATTIAVCNFKQLSVGAATQAGEGGVSTIDYR